jgi:hypothetical protein
MNWTKKHDKFALACNLSESQGYVLRDILRKGKLHEPIEIEVDLRKTNTWIGKVRWQGEFHRKTMTTAIAQLDEKTQGMITVLKRYNPWIYKVLVRPLSFVERIQSAKRASIPKPVTGDPMFSEDHKKNAYEQQQKDISKIDYLLRQIGLKYDADALNRIWRLAGKQIDNVNEAIQLLLYRHNNKAVPRPHGFIIECLKQGWQKGFDMFYEPELPRFNTKEELLEYSLQLAQEAKAKYGGDTIYERVKNFNRCRD